jgi:hypothetical protein
LVVKNTQYCKFAQISVLSFLYYHKNSTVTIYCDEVTHLSLNKIFKHEIANKNVRVVLEKFKSNDWQGAKIEVIAKLKALTGLYLDADLRFNGPLPAKKQLTFFVKEFELEKQNIFCKLESFWRRMDEKDSHIMINTSIIHNGKPGYNFAAQLHISAYNAFECDLQMEFVKLNLSRGEKSQVWRLREQLYLSLIALGANISLEFVKESDSRLDGGIVESTYFGSTGLGF